MGDEAGAASVTSAGISEGTSDGTSEASPGPSREARAIFTFAVTGAVDIFTLVLYGGFAFTDAPLVSALYLIGPLIGAVALLVAAFGLFRRRPWAESVVTPMLIVLIVGGVATLLLTLAFGGLTFPISAIVSVWALLAPPRAVTGERPSSGLVLLGALVLAAVLPFVVLVLPPG